MISERGDQRLRDRDQRERGRQKRSRSRSQGRERERRQERERELCKCEAEDERESSELKWTGSSKWTGWRSIGSRSKAEKSLARKFGKNKKLSGNYGLSCTKREREQERGNHNSLPQQPKNENLEKLKIFRTMLERIIAFLQVSKSNILPGFKDKSRKCTQYIAVGCCGTSATNSCKHFPTGKHELLVVTKWDECIAGKPYSPSVKFQYASTPASKTTGTADAADTTNETAVSTAAADATTVDPYRTDDAATATAAPAATTTNATTSSNE
ncbi:hypothetical protein TEA_023241 [Camellia sinensis var. sinensis]|uniref:Uncharacterized protein n=1 Tax=Camellia sinensis var. sinensis TaxID=542762 RepID=A0A4S4DK91_CAMSN|nr:hypothetical protein TEA_023241 [Camellia sinensis var. sinensis]